jgi:hypothetical protein
MQNEALRKATIELAKSRDRYLDLYEFAPISYITLTASGQITATNLGGAILLGEDRGRLRDRRFERFVAVEDQFQWHQYFRRVQE